MGEAPPKTPAQMLNEGIPHLLNGLKKVRQWLTEIMSHGEDIELYREDLVGQMISVRSAVSCLSAIKTDPFMFIGNHALRSVEVLLKRLLEDRVDRVMVMESLLERIEDVIFLIDPIEWEVLKESDKQGQPEVLAVENGVDLRGIRHSVLDHGLLEAITKQMQRWRDEERAKVINRSWRSDSPSSVQNNVHKKVHKFVPPNRKLVREKSNILEASCLIARLEEDESLNKVFGVTGVASFIASKEIDLAQFIERLKASEKKLLRTYLHSDRPLNEYDQRDDILIILTKILEL